jgi:hypothetical protein
MALTLKQVGRNQTELHKDIGTGHNVIVFFSYETPVAAFIPGQGYSRTTKMYSQTTSRHINKWLGGAEAQPITPEVLANLLG